LLSIERCKDVAGAVLRPQVSHSVEKFAQCGKAERHNLPKRAELVPAAFFNGYVVVFLMTGKKNLYSYFEGCPYLSGLSVIYQQQFMPENTAFDFYFSDPKSFIPADAGTLHIRLYENRYPLT
jgi:hypothetical protein